MYTASGGSSNGCILGPPNQSVLGEGVPPPPKHDFWGPKTGPFDPLQDDTFWGGFTTPVLIENSICGFDAFRGLETRFYNDMSYF